MQWTGKHWDSTESIDLRCFLRFLRCSCWIYALQNMSIVIASAKGTLFSKTKRSSLKQQKLTVQNKRAFPGVLRKCGLGFFGHLEYLRLLRGWV